MNPRLYQRRLRLALTGCEGLQEQLADLYDLTDDEAFAAETRAVADAIIAYAARLRQFAIEQQGLAGPLRW